MVTVRSFVEEGIEEIEYVGVISIKIGAIWLILFEGFNPLRMICVAGYLLQYLNLSFLSIKLLHHKTPKDNGVNFS